MSGVRGLAGLVGNLQPELRPGSFAFATVPRVPDGADPVAWVREAEGITIVVEQAEADRLGLDYAFVAAMITLRVHSALEAVGLTAAVAGTLADAGVSCNVMAGYYHDHLFVPVESGHRAMRLLQEMSAADP